MPNKFIFDTDLNSFDQNVLLASNTIPVLVDFWADWCGPCIVIAPILNQVINEMSGQIKLAKLEVDEGKNMKLAGRYKVRGFPTIMLFEQGQEVARFSSAKPKHFIESFIFEHSKML